MSLFHRTRERLARPPATERPALFILAVEGPKTEPAYFNLFASTRIKATILPPIDHQSSPPQVAEVLIDHCRGLDVPLVAGLDELWLVVDVDHYERHGHLATVAAQAKAEGYRLAVSRPCFEAWLLLHFGDDIDGLTSSKLAKPAMGRIRQTTPGWHGHIDRCILDGLADAVARARTRRAAEPAPRADWPQAPGSDVYRLIERFAAHGVVELPARPSPG